MLWEDNFKKQLPGTIKSTHKRIKEGFVNEKPGRCENLPGQEFLRLTISCSELL
jgi:hypothetical protein